MVIFHSCVSLPEGISDWTIYRGCFFPWGQLVILSAGEEALQKEAALARKRLDYPLVSSSMAAGNIPYEWRFEWTDHLPSGKLT